MNLENFPHPSEHTPTELRNQLQVALAIERGGELEDWVNTYADPFAHIVEEHPELLEHFDTDPENAIEEAKQYLYH